MRFRSQKTKGRYKPTSTYSALCRSVLFSLTSLLLAIPAFAGDVFSGRLYTVPDKIYVNQSFEIHFELEVSFGSEVEDLRISDFPNNPELISVGRLESTSRNRITRDTQALDVLHFTAPARCLKPIEHVFNPTVQCMLVERRNTGFFSHWQSFPKQLKLEPFKLRVLPLPEDGRPATFSGAVGIFRLGGSLSQTNVRPGDIITLSLRLSGQGWLGDVVMPAPPPSPLFKTYPVKELSREPLRLATEQVFIPQNTNATEIASVRFCFFNPATERYENSIAGPFPLTFETVAAASKTEEVRVIDTAQPVSAESLPQTVSIERVNLTLHQALPLLVGCAGALAAFFVFFLLYGNHKRLAFTLGLLVLTTGAVAGYALSGKTVAKTRTLVHRTEIHFAPSRGATTLFSLNQGTAIIPLETAGEWVRVDSSGLRGWIPASSLSEEK